MLSRPKQSPAGLLGLLSLGLDLDEEYHLIELAAAELARAHEHILLLGRKNAQEKVASLLLELARRIGMNEARPSFRLPLSRQEMADHLGLTIETVSRTMSRLKEDGLIALPTPHDVVLLRPEDLTMLAEGAA